MVESIREMKGKVTTERRYYLTSLTDLTTIADTIRNHWSIENNNIGCLMSSMAKMLRKALNVMKRQIRRY